MVTNRATHHKYEFKVHRKDSIINIHVKTTSCISPNTIKSIFKSFLHRTRTHTQRHTHTIFQEKYISQEVQYLIDFLSKMDAVDRSLKTWYANIKKLPCMRNISPKLKHEFKEVGQKIPFTSIKAITKRLQILVRLCMQWEIHWRITEIVLTRNVEHQRRKTA